MKDKIDLFKLLDRNVKNEICAYLDGISIEQFIKDLKHTYNEWYCEDYEV